MVSCLWTIKNRSQNDRYNWTELYASGAGTSRSRDQIQRRHWRHTDEQVIGRQCCGEPIDIRQLQGERWTKKKLR